MTAKSPWRYSSLCEKRIVFGKFEQCLAFHSQLQNQIAPSSQASSTTPSVQFPPQKQILQSEQDVFNYLEASEKAAWDVCIVAFVSPNAASNGELPLPLSRRLFEHTTGTFNISPTFLTVLNTGVARYISPCARDTIGEEWEQARFIVQQNRSYSSYSIALTFNSKTGKVRSLIFGTKEPLSDLFDYLGCVSPLPFGPLIIPTIALELQVEGFNETIESCQVRIRDIENMTGMRQFNHAYESKGLGTQDWRSLDLIDITRNLSGFLSRFAFLKLQAETAAYLVHQMQLSAEFLKTELEKSKEAKSKIDSQHDIQSKLEDLASWYHGIQARSCYLTERTQAQVQTVYNLISSQDNLSSVSIARASRDIAQATRKDSEAMLLITENSRRDNQLMLQIARDSKSVAESTARDSAAMRAIAAATVLFLPATFTATFFSMTFFNFTNDTEMPQASPWIWVYFLATVLLTIIIQTFWTLSNNAKEKEFSRYRE